MSRWDVMDSNMNPPEHSCSYMKMKYLTWIPSIPVISGSGTYTMKYLLASNNNSYKILSPYSATEFFIVEFRRKLSTFENSVPGDGMIVIRINTLANGNSNGPPDEIYCYRPNGTLTANGSPLQAHFSVEAGRTSINRNTNPGPFLSNGQQGGLNIYNIGSYQDSIISFTLGDPTNINNNGIIPQNFELKQNFPNPFNPATEINYSITKTGLVILKVYDLLGREVSTLVNEVQKPGVYNSRFDASALSTGVYFYKIQTTDFSDIKKMIYVK
jgi:hypothetical protein